MCISQLVIMLEAENEQDNTFVLEQNNGVMISITPDENNPTQISHVLFRQYQSSEFSEVFLQESFENVQQYTWCNQTKIQSEFVVKLGGIRPQQFSRVTIYHQPVLKTLFFHQEKIRYLKKIKIVNCVAQGLQDLAKNNICHNAISPEAIAICRECKIDILGKITLFYYSTEIQKGKHTFKKDRRHKRITPYSSPEIRFENQIGLKSDVWSLGALFYYLLFGENRQIKVLIDSVTFQVPTETPEWMRNALKGLLARQPKDRYDISRACFFFRSALVCAQTAQKCMQQYNGKVFDTIMV